MVAAGIGITTAPVSLAIDGIVPLKVAGYDFRRELGLLVDPAWGGLAEVAPQLAEAIDAIRATAAAWRSEEHTSELQSLMRTSYAVLCLKKKIQNHIMIITV